MARPPLLLLPPSEGKAAGGRGPAWEPGSMRFPELDGRRGKVMAALARAMTRSEAKRAELLGVKGATLGAATATNATVTEGLTLPAIERYTGVLYDALDAGGLPATHRRRLTDQVLIFSGLWGVVAPRDPVPDYKLKMGARLPPMGRLSSWWRPAISEALAPLMKGRVVWDLLPQEHDAAWAPGAAGTGGPALIGKVRFLDEVDRDGERRLVAVSHWNKLLKGALVRHVLAHQLTDPTDLDPFEQSRGHRGTESSPA
jgi:cytoplasmic iron level regulating protein YaaA (DUF328/UPF0246 family)